MESAIKTMYNKKPGFLKERIEDGHDKRTR